MTVVGNAIASAAGAVLYWTIAAAAGKRRRRPIGAFPPLLPIVAGGAAAIASSNGAPASAVGLLSGVAVSGWVDARSGCIFDPLSVTIFVTASALSIVEGNIFAGLNGTVCVGAALLFLTAITNGRGLGLGDVKLGAAVGMALGMATGLAAMGAAFVLGACYGVALIVTKRANGSTPVAFGPFIAAGTFVSVLCPTAIHS